MRSAGKSAVAPVHELHTKAARHARIVSLVKQRPVRSQAELARALAAEGITVNQATLSRDLDELGAVKLRAPDGGQPVYVVPADGAPLAARADDDPAPRLARLLSRTHDQCRGEREPRGPAHPARRFEFPGQRTRPCRDGTGARDDRRR